MSVFEYHYHVGIRDVSANALITNAGMLSLLEDVACKHSDTVGIGIREIPTIHISWVLLAWKVEIIKRVSYGADLKIRTWARPSQKFYTYREFEVFDENNALVCIATSKWTLINTQKHSIERITDDVILRYEPEDRRVFEEPEIEKLPEPTDFSSFYLYTTQRRDIDINEHMHNLNYLYLAYEALPMEIFEKEENNHIMIMYKKGMKLR